MLIKRFPMELATAALTGLLGLMTTLGSLDLGFGWSESGPEPGYFPFYLGLLLIAASLANAVQAILRFRREGGSETFIEPEQGRRLLSFFGPMLCFVIVTVYLGLYVGSTLYLTYVAWRQGRYHPVFALALGVGFSIALYVVFEILFKVPLHKGPLELMLGIY